MLDQFPDFNMRIYHAKAHEGTRMSVFNNYPTMNDPVYRITNDITNIKDREQVREKVNIKHII